jgi:hypothetical protein
MAVPGFVRLPRPLFYDHALWALRPWHRTVANNLCESFGRPGDEREVNALPARAEQVSQTRLWRPWLRINRVMRVMLHTRWSVEA